MGFYQDFRVTLIPFTRQKPNFQANCEISVAPKIDLNVVIYLFKTREGVETLWTSCNYIYIFLYIVQYATGCL